VIVSWYAFARPARSVMPRIPRDQPPEAVVGLVALRERPRDADVPFVWKVRSVDLACFEGLDQLVVRSHTI